MVTTLAVLHALGDANQCVACWPTSGGSSILDYVATHAAEFADRDAASAGQLVVALTAAGLDPYAFGHLNAVARLQAHFDPRSGRYDGHSGSVADEIWAILGLAAAREAIPDTVTTWLLAQQDESGGWAASGGQPDTETTALAAAALVGAGASATDSPLLRAMIFLGRAETGRGGLARNVDCHCPPDARSTARATLAILALARDPLKPRWQQPGGSPPGWLLSVQRADGGIGYDADGASDVLSTAYAVSALLGRVLPPQGRQPGVRAGLEWLHRHQTPDGGMAADVASPDAALTIQATYAIAGAGQPPETWRSISGATPLDYLAGHAPANTAADIGRLILAVVAADRDPHSLAGADLVARLASHLDASKGAYGPSVPDQAWALLALAALHLSPPTGAQAFLASLQAQDGGWSVTPGTPADTVTTSLAIQALRNPPADAVQHGLAYLRQRQQADGGFSATAVSTATSARATALAILALVAIGQDPDGTAWSRHLEGQLGSALPAHTPLRALLALQNSDGGFRLQAGFAESDGLATAEAIAALSGRPYPVRYAPIRLFLPAVGR